MVVWLISAIACGETPGIKEPEDGLDAGREFLRAVLDGDYKRAEMYVLQDDEDQLLFKRYVEYMRKRSGEELIGLKQATIIISKIDQVSDSVQVIHYSNSFSKKPADVKVVRKDDKWWVDFSFTFSPTDNQPLP